jgi:hypothetical protein
LPKINQVNFPYFSFQNLLFFPKPQSPSNKSKLKIPLIAGTGKTIAFLSIALSQLLTKPQLDSLPQTLILTPTRELALQIFQVINLIIGKLDATVKSAVFVGGLPIQEVLFPVLGRIETL